MNIHFEVRSEISLDISAKFYFLLDESVTVSI